MKKQLLLLALIACTKLSFSQSYTSTGRILIDFGVSANLTPTVGWNNVTGVTLNSTTLASNNGTGNTSVAAGTVINSTGQTTPFTLTVHDDFHTPVANSSGPTYSDYPANATIDNIYGVGVVGGSFITANPTGGITFANLDLTKLYSFTFYAGRITTENRETKFTVTAKTSEVLYQNAGNGVGNNNVAVTTSFLQPDDNGKIVIDVTYGPNNTNVNKFYHIGVFDINYKPTTLPVTFNSFEAINKNDGVSLKWQTLSESNSSHFEILRSTDSNNFNSIGTVAAKGISSSLVDYTFTDFNPTNGTNYYQLKQVDLDDKFSLSKILSVKAGLNTKAFEANYIDGNINLFFNNEGKGNVATIILSDISGRIIGTYSKNVSAGFNKIPLNSSLTNGVYIINFSSGNSSHKAKFIVGN